MQRLSFLLVLGIVSLLALGSYSGYKFWQKADIEEGLQVLESSMEDLNKKILEKENRKVTQAIAAKQTTESLKKDLIYWSKVIKQIRRTIPLKEDQPLIEILSYSGSGNQSIALNVKTLADSENPYFDVADLIDSFENSKSFRNPFVPSISSGKNEEGEEILTFLFNVEHVDDPSVVEEVEEAEPISR